MKTYIAMLKKMNRGELMQECQTLARSLKEPATPREWNNRFDMWEFVAELLGEDIMLYDGDPMKGNQEQCNQIKQ